MGSRSSSELGKGLRDAGAAKRAHPLPAGVRGQVQRARLMKLGMRTGRLATRLGSWVGIRRRCTACGLSMRAAFSSPTNQRRPEERAESASHVGGPQSGA